MTSHELAAQMMERNAAMLEQLAQGYRHMAHLLRESEKFPAGENVARMPGGKQR